MRCTNPKCTKTKPISFFRKMFNDNRGLDRGGHWYCSAGCFDAPILEEFFRRKLHRSEIHSSTHPVTARAFGAALLRMGKITWIQLEEAMEEKSINGGKPLAHYLLKKNLINRKDILEALGKHHRVPVAFVSERELDPAMIGLVPAAVARLAGVIPINYNKTNRKLSLLMKDPSDLTTMITIRKLLRCNVQPFQGDPAEIERLLTLHYSEMPQGDAPLTGSIAERLAVAQ